MEYTGLIRKYPINRFLTDQERERQLRRGERLDVEPAYQLSMIRMSSTYVELVDKFFEWKGFLTAFAIVVAVMFVAGISAMGVSSIIDGSIHEFWPHLVGMFLVLVVPILFVAQWMFRKDAFTYTHYPIRLNRKTRMVHVFRVDGTVLSVPWGDVFFCIGSLPQSNYEIQGHVLDTDGKTVRETFSFCDIAGSWKESESLKHYWEFVRRYMEDVDLGPIHVHARYVLPIANKRESFMQGWDRSLSMFGALPFPLKLGLLAIYVVTYPGRWIAMTTSKLPVWPEEVEATCLIEPGDPYVRDARDNPVGLR
ncbi:MAG TPA: hypothetical protein PK620_03495 [Denitromonas sp.]|uniref:DUF6708 domain-containing protein n=1 Tax=Denitromonas sp. TaxID=2734609 RepID=UPI001DB62167|nr:hypothetical protein [Rhodocyclaceae bacterium]MCP5220435.1 hypothetical protein [Zoogloeaceae bacterium]HQU87664.1 hypothetical protein [Denitromonas sp.]HQV13957.1 hypothetical protein [Denitromonas sp.]